MRVVLIRHGLTVWNAAQRLQGHEDIELSETGKLQAKDLRATLAGLEIERLVSSDLRRAQETAQLAGLEGYDLDPALRERDAGSWTGKHIADVKANGGENWKDWMAGTFVPPGAETWDAFDQRAVGAIKRHCEGVQGNLVVVCHGGVIRAALTNLLGLPPDGVTSVAHASLTCVQLDEHQKKTRLELFNFRPSGIDLETPE